MAERRVVELVDDVDGSPARNTIEFALDGVRYEIDLNDGNAEALRTVLDRYIRAARKLKPVPRRTTSGGNARAANERITEQIRSAAQRSRTTARNDAPAGERGTPVAATDQPVLIPSPAPPARPESVRPVSLPQFSAASES